MMCEHIDYKGEGFFITYSYSTTITHLIFYLLYSNEQLQIIRIIDVLRYYVAFTDPRLVFAGWIKLTSYIYTVPLKLTSSAVFL